MATFDRVLIHRSGFRRVPVDPLKIFYLEADGDETVIRTRSSRRTRDVRSLGEVLPAFLPHGFLRVHRNHAVNLRRIREIKRRDDGVGWELRLQPPVNRVLPIGRSYEAPLWRAYGS